MVIEKTGLARRVPDATAGQTGHFRRCGADFQLLLAIPLGRRSPGSGQAVILAIMIALADGSLKRRRGTLMRRAVRWFWLVLLCWMPCAGWAEDIRGASRGPASPPASLDARQIEIIRRAALDPKKLAQLLDKPLYNFTEADVDLYLTYLQATEPDLRRRIVHVARKNIGQPYEPHLMGEWPFELHDPQPLYCLGKSDGLSFAEHAYAMALSGDWPSFMASLQRIRYRGGRIGVATRNHFTDADWEVSNGWLVHDITADLAGDKLEKYEQTIDRAAFLKKNFGLKADVPVATHRDVFIPLSAMTQIEAKLQDGDFVNAVLGIVTKQKEKEKEEDVEKFGGKAFVGHVGIVANGRDGTVNMIHSSEPAVREEPIVDYIARWNKDRGQSIEARKPVLVGFKFLRLEDDPLAKLRKIDGDDAPQVTLPRGGRAKF
jgi:hypothetical protein